MKKRVENPGSNAGALIHRRDLRKIVRPHHSLSYVVKTSIGQNELLTSLTSFRPRTSLDETLSSWPLLHDIPSCRLPLS